MATGSTNIEQGSLTSVDGGRLQCQSWPLVTFKQLEQDPGKRGAGKRGEF